MASLPEHRAPTVFIGSSSEGSAVAAIVHGFLVNDCRPYHWKHGLFTASTYPLETLEHEIKTRDFAVIVGTSDDLLVKRGRPSDAIRDNLVFELGFFMGGLGRRHTFLMIPRDAELDMPSDLLGLSTIRYDAAQFNQGYQERLAAMSQPCLELREAIMRVWGLEIAERERQRRMALSSSRLNAIRRLHGLVVDLRDLLIVFPGKLLDSLSDRQRFDQIKIEMSKKVESSSKTFREDPELADLLQQIDGLVDATKSAIVSFPYPEDVLVTQAELNDTVKTLIQNYGVQVLSGAPLLKTLSDNLESEIDRRAANLAKRYEDWWRSSHEGIQAATNRLQDAMCEASFLTQERLLAEYNTR